jgi:thioesterase domain-containing protein
VTTEALRAHLVSVLPEYMVPAAYVRLDALPLTANGKLDRRALPAPEGEACVLRGYEAPQGELETTVAQLWSELLGLERVGRHDNFFELGGHSLLAVQVVSRIQRTLNLDVSLRELLAHPNLAEFAANVGAQAEPPCHPNLLPIRVSGELPPLFMIHDGGGSIEYARKLAEELDVQVPIYGVVASGFASNESPDTSMSSMASRYVAAIRAVQAHGPYRLVGYSAGGVVAYAMADHLLAAGESVGFLGLIDCYCGPESIAQFSDTVAMIEAHRGTGLDETAALKAWTEVRVPHAAREEYTALSARGDVSAMLEFLRRFDVIPDELDDQFVHRLLVVSMAVCEALATYAMPTLPISATLFHAAQREVSDPTLGWGTVLAERLSMVSIGDDHWSLFAPPRIAELGAALMSALRGVDARGA